MLLRQVLGERLAVRGRRLKRVRGVARRPYGVAAEVRVKRHLAALNLVAQVESESKSERGSSFISCKR